MSLPNYTPTPSASPLRMSHVWDPRAPLPQSTSFPLMLLLYSFGRLSAAGLRRRVQKHLSSAYPRPEHLVHRAKTRKTTESLSSQRPLRIVPTFGRPMLFLHSVTERTRRRLNSPLNVAACALQIVTCSTASTYGYMSALSGDGSAEYHAASSRLCLCSVRPRLSSDLPAAAAQVETRRGAIMSSQSSGDGGVRLPRWASLKDCATCATSESCF